MSTNEKVTNTVLALLFVAVLAGGWLVYRSMRADEESARERASAATVFPAKETASAAPAGAVPIPGMPGSAAGPADVTVDPATQLRVPQAIKPSPVAIPGARAPLAQAQARPDAGDPARK